MKLDMKQALNVLYQLCDFWANRKNKDNRLGHSVSSTPVHDMWPLFAWVGSKGSFFNEFFVFVHLVCWNDYIGEFQVFSNSSWYFPVKKSSVDKSLYISSGSVLVPGFIYCVACEVCLSVHPSVCPSVCHTSYVFQATHAFLGMLPLFFYMPDEVCPSVRKACKHDTGWAVSARTVKLGLHTSNDN